MTTTVERRCSCKAHALGPHPILGDAIVSLQSEGITHSDNSCGKIGFVVKTEQV